jgi:hypothetical protein
MYAPGALGETSSYWGIDPESDEVYLMRARVSGFKPKTPMAALKLVESAGKAMPPRYNIRAIAFKLTDPASVDLVVTYVGGLPQLVKLAPQATEKRMNEGFTYSGIEWPGLDFYLPGAKVEESKWLVLQGPASALRYWRKHPIIWDHAANPKQKVGGPTKAFQNGEGVYRGTAEEYMGPVSVSAPDPFMPSQTMPTVAPPRRSSWAVVFLAVAGLFGYMAWRDKK